MSRPLLVALIVVLVASLGLALVVLAGNGSDPDAVPDSMEGDVSEIVEALDPGEMVDQAHALLATDRPWRAAQVMRRYLREATDAPADHRLLAVRAEAGSGAWPEVLALLEGLPALDTYEDGIGLYLLGRARDHADDARGAVEAYRAFLALSAPAGALQDERAAARLRLGLALVRAGDRAGARTELAASRSHAGNAAVWIDLLEADALAQTGDAEAVRQAVARFDSGVQGLRAWRARITAAERAGDLAAARALANQARAWAQTAATRAEFLVAAGRLAVAMGDEASGRGAFRNAIAQSDSGPAAREAAERLQAGPMTPADHLAVARVLKAQGLHREALEGYRTWLDAREGTAGERSRVALEYADALFYAERYDEVEAALRPVAGQREAQMLLARTEAHRGRYDQAVRIYLDLAGQGGSGAALALYLAADTRHHEGDTRRAREIYERVVAQHAGSTTMGLAMMRIAGIAYLEGNHAEAARWWDRYRQQYPRGALATQATYWAGRAREAQGDREGAAALYRAVRQRERDSYYALLASEHLGQPFWPLPMGASPPDDPAAAQRVAGWMRGIDLLRAAGFPEEASAEADRVVSAAGGDRATRFALAEALAERGYSRRAIQIGLGLQAAGQNRRVLRILYPFPYRTLITEEARDRGLDPFVTAALIRQESMFEERITSPAGARGLMQIMPATGRRLAEAAGVEPWDAERLYHAEINVHLGTRYVAQHWDTYDGSLPAVFSAYNAGAHRVEWWSAFPEFGNDPLFTERIPFRETRDYVKILTRNHALYQGLYGAGAEAR